MGDVSHTYYQTITKLHDVKRKILYLFLVFISICKAMCMRYQTTLKLSDNMQNPVPVQIIDLDDDSPQAEITFSQSFYFGHLDMHLKAQQLYLKFKFKHELISPQLQEQQQIQAIAPQEYRLSRVQLTINDQDLTASLRQAFGNIMNLGLFLKEQIGNPNVVTIDQQKMTLSPQHKDQVVLYFSNYRNYDKNELLRQLQRFKTATQSSDKSWQQVDETLLVHFTEQELNRILFPEVQPLSNATDSISSDSQFSDLDSKDSLSEDISEQPEEELPVSELSEVSSVQQEPTSTYASVFKQNQVPIYQRFRHVNINCSRREKIKLSEQMLQIGYLKEDIMKFFSGGAAQMEAEAKRMPDYRDPQSARYKQIHLIVAKRQYQRHSELLAKHGLPPIDPLPEYECQGPLYSKGSPQHDKRVKELLIHCIKFKKMKRLDEIQLEIKRQGVNATLPALKKIVEELREKHKKKEEQPKELNEEEPSSE